MLYVDTGIVTKWYLPETDSFSALALRDRFSPPAVLNGLHRLELNNAWQLKVFRGELSTDMVALAWTHFVEDVQAGLWHIPDEPWSAIHSRAAELAQMHSATLGTRSLDILHVAAAEQIRCSHFLTGDQRQARLAEVIGLSVVLHQSH